MYVPSTGDSAITASSAVDHGLLRVCIHVYTPAHIQIHTQTCKHTSYIHTYIQIYKHVYIYI